MSSRREFITLLGGAAAAWPLAANAQLRTPVIGFLSSRSAEDSVLLFDGWRRGLSDVGLAEGHDYSVEPRWADGRYERLSELANELVRRQVSIIAAVGGNISALAAKAASLTIPIIFVVGTDPIKDGLVSSFNRPGGNATGVSLVTAELGPKRLELLRELVPSDAIIAVLINPKNPDASARLSEVLRGAAATSQQIQVFDASTADEIDASFTMLAQRSARGLIVMPDPFFNSRSEQINALASNTKIAAIFDSREHTVAGGLISYGTSYVETYRLAGVYTGRVLKGERPSELPVLQPTKFDLVVNLDAHSAQLTSPRAESTNPLRTLTARVLFCLPLPTFSERLHVGFAGDFVERGRVPRLPASSLRPVFVFDAFVSCNHQAALWSEFNPDVSGNVLRCENSLGAPCG
jgi:putative tryptophan/tyrosine transport system substrate-binding protein